MNGVQDKNIEGGYGSFGYEARQRRLSIIRGGKKRAQ